MSQSSHSLIMFFAFCPFFLIVGLRFGYVFAVPIYGDHHSYFRTSVDLFGCLCPFLSAGTIVECGLAKIKCQPGFVFKAIYCADFCGCVNLDRCLVQDFSFWWQRA
jgi:hypothetical protein